jgi:hypothetical protein
MNAASFFPSPRAPPKAGSWVHKALDAGLRRGGHHAPVLSQRYSDHAVL